jgi:hypothetical protein
MRDINGLATWEARVGENLTLAAFLGEKMPNSGE